MSHILMDFSSSIIYKELEHNYSLIIVYTGSYLLLSNKKLGSRFGQKSMYNYWVVPALRQGAFIIRHQSISRYKYCFLFGYKSFTKAYVIIANNTSFQNVAKNIRE